MQISRILALAAFGMLASAPVRANSPDFQAVTVEAADCQIIPASTSRLPRLGTAWTLQGNGRTLLNCSVPVAAKVGSVVTGFRVLYRDPDGLAGNANVKVILDNVYPGTLNPPFDSPPDCKFNSRFNGVATPNWTVADFTCPSPVLVPPGSHLIFLVELFRRAPVTTFPGFAAIDFP